MTDDATVESATDQVTDQHTDAANQVAELIQATTQQAGDKQVSEQANDRDDKGQDDDSALSEIKALADELGVTPGQLKGRLEASRKWESRAKSNAKAAEEAQQAKAQMSAIAEALGLSKDDKSDPETLQKSLAEKDDLLWELQLERAADKAARKHGADPELLVPVLFHGGQLDELNPDSEDWDETVDRLAAELVKKNPKLRSVAATTPVPDLKQGSRGGAQRSEDPNDWLRSAARRR